MLTRIQNKIHCYIASKTAKMIVSAYVCMYVCIYMEENATEIGLLRRHYFFEAGSFTLVLELSINPHKLTEIKKKKSN